MKVELAAKTKQTRTYFQIQWIVSNIPTTEQRSSNHYTIQLTLNCNVNGTIRKAIREYGKETNKQRKLEAQHIYTAHS